MTEGMLIEIMRMTLRTIALMSAPMIGVVVLVGILSQVFQTVTQLKDQSMSFVPKVVVSGILLTLCIPWYINLIQKYVEYIFSFMSQGGAL